MEFVVQVIGEEPAKGYWVLDVDAHSGSFLVANEDGTFRWLLSDKCRFVRAANPEVPRPVVLVQPKPGLAVPQLHVGNGRGQ